MHTGGAGENSALYGSTLTHVVYGGPSNSKPFLQL